MLVFKKNGHKRLLLVVILRAGQSCAYYVDILRRMENIMYFSCFIFAKHYVGLLPKLLLFHLSYTSSFTEGSAVP